MESGHVPFARLVPELSTPSPLLHPKSKTIRKLKIEAKWLNQVHKNRTIDLDICNYDVADSSFCSKKKVASVIMVADCLPILVATANGVLIGSIHAGWRGLCNNIIENFFINLNKKINKLKKEIN